MKNERVLLERAKVFDVAALGELYDHYAPRIYASIYRRVGSAHLAKDLTGDVFVRVLQAIGLEIVCGPTDPTASRAGGGRGKTTAPVTATVLEMAAASKPNSLIANDVPIILTTWVNIAAFQQKEPAETNRGCSICTPRTSSVGALYHQHD